LSFTQLRQLHRIREDMIFRVSPSSEFSVSFIPRCKCIVLLWAGYKGALLSWLCGHCGSE